MKSENYFNNGTKVISAFFKNRDESNMKNLIEYALNSGFDDSEIVALAQGLANSGKQIKSTKFGNICDIPSTGGPASLSTLLCPLFLSLLGDKVLKLGVPGRPAGGIDVLAQIDGYKINPDISELEKWIQKSNYVHFLANENYTPLDAKLFEFRKQNGALNIPALVIASLLSKKIAVGLNYLGLDIRVSAFGNFGNNWEDARENAVRFNRIANMCGIRAKSFLTYGGIPQQPYIGRGEAILALRQIFENKISTSLKKHIEYCLSMAVSISRYSEKEIQSLTSIEKAFFENISVQGGSIDSFYKIATQTEIRHIYSIRAKKCGFLQIDMEGIRNCIVAIQKKYKEHFADPCGIILNAMADDYICPGDEICSFRCDKIHYAEFEGSLNRCFEIQPTMPNSNNFEEII